MSAYVVSKSMQSTQVVISEDKTFTVGFLSLLQPLNKTASREAECTRNQVVYIIALCVGLWIRPTRVPSFRESHLVFKSLITQTFLHVYNMNLLNNFQKSDRKFFNEKNSQNSAHPHVLKLQLNQV